MSHVPYAFTTGHNIHIYPTPPPQTLNQDNADSCARLQISNPPRTPSQIAFPHIVSSYHNSSSLSPTTLFSTASLMVPSANTGPCPSHFAWLFNLSLTAAISTTPCFTSGCAMIKSHADAAASSRPPLSGSLTMRWLGVVLSWP